VTNPLNRTNIQFNGSDATSAKLRRLVEDIVAAEAAINGLIQSVALLSEEEAAGGAQLLANAAGLGPNFTVEGLTKGQVLTALTATTAAFRALTIQSLTDVALSDPTDGEVLTFFHGQLINAPVPSTGPGAGGENIGTGEGVFAGVLGPTLAFKSIQGDGISIGVTATGDTITIEFLGGAGGLSFAQASALVSMRI
jgi:hypothetical protein